MKSFGQNYLHQINEDVSEMSLMSFLAKLHLEIY